MPNNGKLWSLLTDHYHSLQILSEKVDGRSLSTAQINDLIMSKGALSAMKDRRYEYEQYQNCSPLMVAGLRDLADVTKVILKELKKITDSDVYHEVLNLQDSNGQSALMFASLKSHHKVTELLLRGGAWVDQQDKDGQSALLLASSNGNTKVAEILLEGGANIDLQDKKGLSALMHASKNIRCETAELLIEKGADPDQQSLEWETATSLAMRQLQSESSKNSELLERQSKTISILEKKLEEVSPWT